MGLYAEKLLPSIIDVAMRGDEIDVLRARTLAPARGRVLEVGFGTGLNARHYGRDVDELVVVDPNPGMSPLAHERLARAQRRAEHICVSGEALPFGDHSFDTVVVTFTLCSIPDVHRALAEMRRVLKPGGQLLFCEHNLGDAPSTQRWQRRITPLWSRVGGGCHLDRDAPSLIEQAGFVIDELEKTRLGTSPLVWGTIRRGVARPRA
jgi:ubiquinone/menaquinone biosynthesis C-methylase UbiE